MRSVGCRTYTGKPSDECNPRYKPHNIQECYTSCDKVEKKNDNKGKKLPSLSSVLFQPGAFLCGINVLAILIIFYGVLVLLPL